MNTTLIEDILNEWKCSICLDIATEPIIASCTLHTFCYKCLSNWIKQKKEKEEEGFHLC